MIVAVSVCFASLYAQAQTISGNTSNLINPAGTAWGIPGSQVLNSGGIGAIEGGGPTTGSAYYNQDTNTIRFSYMPSTVTQSIAINSALAGTGIKWLGYDYAWSIMNGGQASGPLRADIYLKSNNAVLETWTHNYAAGSQPAGSFQLYSGRQLFSQSGGYTTGQLASLDMSWTGQDSLFWNGLYGPRVRDTNVRLLYGVDQCVANPLSDANCPGYAAAFFNQQCTISALYNPACPGYAAAYFTQQCTVSALYNPACPGYAEAYFAYQCNLDAFYSQSCPKYAEAYAKKNILNIGSTTTATTASTSTPTTTVKTDGTVNTEVSRTGDSTIDSAISTPSTTSTTGVTSVTSSTSTVNKTDTVTTVSNTVSSQPAQSTSTASSQSPTQETKKTDGEIKSVASGSTNTAKARAEARAREVAQQSAGAATFEAQTAVQGTVVALMGFVPGFDAYGTARITDVNGLQMARQYGRATVDNRAALRGLTGASDRLHSDMVDQQYQRGK